MKYSLAVSVILSDVFVIYVGTHISLFKRRKVYLLYIYQIFMSNKRIVWDGCSIESGFSSLFYLFYFIYWSLFTFSQQFRITVALY